MNNQIPLQLSNRFTQARDAYITAGMLRIDAEYVERDVDQQQVEELRQNENNAYNIMDNILNDIRNRTNNLHVIRTFIGRLVDAESTVSEYERAARDRVPNDRFRNFFGNVIGVPAAPMLALEPLFDEERLNFGFGNKKSPKKRSPKRLSVGTKSQVWKGLAKKTSKGLTKKDLMKNKNGNVVMRK
jgi:hypothetical protein